MALLLRILINIFDSILGIIPPNNKLDASRSISDEVEPNETIIQGMRMFAPRKVFLK